MSVARTWLAAFNTWDLPTLHGTITEAQDFRYGVLPASVGMAPKSRSEWCVYSATVSRLLPDFKIKILDIHDTSEPGPVVAHIETKGTPRTGAQFSMECIMFIYIRSEKGALKLHKVDEFADTRYVDVYFSAERERRKVDGSRKDPKVGRSKL